MAEMGATAEGRDRTHLFPLCADSGRSRDPDRAAVVDPNATVAKLRRVNA